MLENRQKKMEEFLKEIDLTQEAPSEEPQRQYYFIEKARHLVRSPGASADLSCDYFRVSDECQGFREADRNFGADWICGRS